MCISVCLFHRQVTELITDYFVGPLLFEESLSLAIEGQADSRLTVENATEDILDGMHCYTQTYSAL